MAHFESVPPENPELLYESALAYLVRKGAKIDRASVSFPKYQVAFSNYIYYFEKQDRGIIAGIIDEDGLSIYQPFNFRNVRLSGTDFADFVFEFDELIPLLSDTIDRVVLAGRIQAAQFDIIRQTADSLGERILSPVGIEWRLDPEFSQEEVTITFFLEGKYPYSGRFRIDGLEKAFLEMAELMPTQANKPVVTNLEVPAGISTVEEFEAFLDEKLFGEKSVQRNDKPNTGIYM